MCYWTTLKHVLDTYDSIIEQCDVHLLYLGRGLYIKLVKRDTPLRILDNPDPSVKSLLVRELTKLESTIYDDVLHTSLGKGLNPDSSSNCVTTPDSEFKSDRLFPLDLCVPTESPECQEQDQNIPMDLSVESAHTIDLNESSRTPLSISEEAALSDEPLSPNEPQAHLMDRGKKIKQKNMCPKFTKKRSMY